MQDLESEGVTLADAEERVAGWQDTFFPDREQHFGTNLLGDLFRIARHKAQNGVVPRFFKFEERDRHDLDAIAEEFVRKDLGPLATDEALAHEYSRQDRLWSTIYYRYDLFKSQYDACVNRILHAKRHGVPSAQHRPKRNPLPSGERLVGSEPSEDLKLQVKERDQRCLCCDSRSKRGWQVDHIASHYYGGGNPLDNLQTLCGECNRAKGTQTINFRNTRTMLSEAPASFPNLKSPTGRNAADLEQWRRYVFRSINLFYGCAATHLVDIGNRGERFYNWYVELKPGNDPRWVEPLLENILIRVRRDREKAGYGVPDTITVFAPELNKITVKAKSGE